MKSILLILLLCAPLAAETTTAPSTDRVPRVVVLKELADRYEPVPFDHGTHSKMAEMWNGCETCHHRSPAAATTQRVQLHAQPTQADAGSVPACKSCHPVDGAERAGVSISTPSLKGAYHRQCLNCHREWTGENACVICHAPRNGHAGTTAPSPDDIVGRMHPPIPAPREARFRARFTPVAGANVLFRHEAHVQRFGIRCATCHRRDNCSDCHSAGAGTAVNATAAPNRPRPLHPGKTWRDTHGPCVSCHEGDRCTNCHFPDGAKPPPPFDHAAKTGQSLDADHAGLACKMCHVRPRSAPSFGEVTCHLRSAGDEIAFPIDRPGPYEYVFIVSVQSTTKPTTEAVTSATTRPVITRIRRGGAR